MWRRRSGRRLRPRRGEGLGRCGDRTQRRALLGDLALGLQPAHDCVQPGRIDAQLSGELGDRDPRTLTDEPRHVLLALAGRRSVATRSLRRPGTLPAARVAARGFGSDFEGLLAAALECFGAGAASRTAAAGADRETLADALRADARGLAASVARASFVLLGRGQRCPRAYTGLSAAL